jgi:membrane protease YdiL (CAAX protease family)
VAVALPYFAFVAVFQEVLFRGVLLHMLMRRLGFWAAAALTSLAFSAIHLGQMIDVGLEIEIAGLVCLFLFGMLCALSVPRTGSIWWAVGLHGAWNLTQDWVVRLMPDRADDWLGGGALGLEASPLTIALLVAGLIAWSRRGPRH